ncbi:MAG: two-component regulator propeller domain-containing protein [Bacteroidota bacterium]
MKKVYILLALIHLFAGSQNASGQAEISPSYESVTDLIMSGLKDNNGNLWFATYYRGLYRYDGKSFVHYTEKDGLNNNAVNCIYEDKDGILWFGTGDGVCYYDGKSFNSFPLSGIDSSNLEKDKYPNSLGKKNVESILQDKTGNFWFVTESDGVFLYDGKSFTVFLSNETLRCISEDKTGNILVGSWQGGGVYRYDGKAFIKFNGFSDGMIFCMLKDKLGNIWVGTRNQGVDRYDGKTLPNGEANVTNFSVKDSLSSSNNIDCIFEDTKGNIWFGRDEKIKRGDAFCYDGKSFTNITAKAYLPVVDGFLNGVRTIVEDNAGNIWIGSRNGILLCYDGKRFINFSEKVSK